MNNHWPESDEMSVCCPNCESIVAVQITVVREFDDPLRPADCQCCHAEFHLFSDGATELLSAPPRWATARGHELRKQFQNLVFDPNG